MIWHELHCVVSQAVFAFFALSKRRCLGQLLRFCGVYRGLHCLLPCVYVYIELALAAGYIYTRFISSTTS